jgi:hypothetical protein
MAGQRVPWAARVLNTLGNPWGQAGWLLAGVALIGVWIWWPAQPLHAAISGGVAVVGLLLAAIVYISGAITNRRLATAIYAPGTLTGCKPAGMQGSLPQVELTYAYAVDGNTYAVTTVTLLTPRIAVQALNALLAWVTATVQEAGANHTDDPASHPAVRELRAVDPQALLTRVLTEGWEAVRDDYVARAAKVAVGEMALAADTSAPVAAMMDGTPQVNTLVGDGAAHLLDAARDAVNARIGGGAVDAAHAFARRQLEVLLNPDDELIFFDPAQPEAGMPASALPARLTVGTDGALTTGVLAKGLALLALPLPLLVTVGHGLTALIRLLPR